MLDPVPPRRSADRQGAPQVDMSQALPRVADAPVDLDGGLAHIASRSGAIGLGHRSRGQRVIGRERIDGPGRMQGDAAGPLHQHERIGQHVLHGLKGTDGCPELLAEGGVVGRQLHGAAHDADQVGRGQGQAQGGPVVQVVVADRPIRHDGGTGHGSTQPPGRSGQIDAMLLRGQSDLHHPMAVRSGRQEERMGGSGRHRWPPTMLRHERSRPARAGRA